MSILCKRNSGSRDRRLAFGASHRRGADGHRVPEQDLPDALGGLPWIVATDSNHAFRNATEAVRMSERACELTGRNDPAKLKTLAVAYAEAGRFPEVIAAAQAANDLAARARNKSLADKFLRMPEQFKGAQPWREQKE